MTKCHAVPAKMIKLSYGSGPLPLPAEKMNDWQQKLGEFAALYEFAQLFVVFQCVPRGRGQVYRLVT